jgi:hypothetical protein
MVQPHPSHGLREAIGFGGVKGLGLFLKINIAVGASAGAGRPHDQEGGCAVVEALANVGAGGFLTNRV